MEIGEVIYQETFNSDKDKINNLWNAIGKEGIWVMLGKRNDTDLYTFLNVGRNKDIGRELLYDISCMNFLSFHDSGNDEYINQFGESCGFKSDSQWTQEYLYPYIRSEYKTIAFVYVHNISDGEVEKKIAWITKAEYWRNGNKFKNPENKDYYKAGLDEMNIKNPFHSVDKLSNIIEKLNNSNYISV